ILMGAEDAFGAGRVSVFLCDARGGTIREQHHVQALLNRRVDGLIVVGNRTDPRPSLGRELPVPVVYAYAPSEDPEDLSIICDNDQVARGVLDVVRERGRDVPDDVAVMGFDNWEVLTTDARPPLTSVDMNLEEMGRAAARALFAALDGAPRSGLEALPCRIVI